LETHNSPISLSTVKETMYKKMIAVLVTSSLMLFTACQGLIPPVEVTDPFGLEGAEVEGTLDTNVAPTGVRPQAVTANFNIKGAFGDYKAPENPVPISLSFTPRVRSFTFKSCSPQKESYTLTFNKFTVKVADGVGTPAERSYQSPTYDGYSFEFRKTATGTFEPVLEEFKGLFVVLNWEPVKEIINLPASGVNTPNSGFLSFSVTSEDDSLKGCGVTLKFAGGKGQLKF
jgi:hypothetical protein